MIATTGDWLGDLHKVGLPESLLGIICIGVSGLCGAIVGLERERRDKPAGLRTLILISVGSTIFTMASILIGQIGFGDRGRIAAQVVTGIGFLGAGSILQARGAVVGLTTAATIWVVAAIGVVVGAGFAVAGLVLSSLVFLILAGIKKMEARVIGPCQNVRVRVEYRTDHGKTRQRVTGTLDEHHVPESAYTFSPPGEGEPAWVEIQYCTRHRTHRAFLPKLAALEDVVSIEELGR